MPEKQIDRPGTDKGLSRRKLLTAGVAAGGAFATGAVSAKAASAPDPLITEIQDFSVAIAFGVPGETVRCVSLPAWWCSVKRDN